MTGELVALVGQQDSPFVITCDERDSTNDALVAVAVVAAAIFVTIRFAMVRTVGSVVISGLIAAVCLWVTLNHQDLMRVVADGVYGLHESDNGGDNGGTYDNYPNFVPYPSENGWGCVDSLD